MVEASRRSRPGDDALARPGWLGRVIRLTLGIGTSSLFLSLAGPWRAEMWSGEIPFLDSGFLVLACLALWCSGYVFNIGFGLGWGERTRVGLLAGAALTGVIDWLSGGFPGPLFGVYLWTWFAALTGLLGVALVLAAALATPGCEMRSYLHLFTRLRGGDVDTVVCPGGIDRWDHVGRETTS